METAVLIVGAGPVGLTLAMDLARRGIEVVVAEVRYPREIPTVRCNHVSARSMEIFRQLGLAQAVRNAGLPEDHAHDVSFRTTVTGPELTRIFIPSRRDRFTATAGPDGWWPTPEPPHRINQLYLEPIMFDHAASMARIRLLNRTRIEGFVPGETAVAATARNLDTQESYTIECQYLVGCDGGSSGIRKAMGAKLVGDAVVQRVQSTYIRAPKLMAMMQCEPAWGTVALNPRRSGTLYAIDGRERWIVHNYLKESESDFEAINRDWAIRTILGVDGDFEYEVLANEDWIGRRLVADRLRNGRVFICGDAAHIWVPYGGYGMNAGIADAANLAWLLAARLHGWGGTAILDAYERERHPITEQVSYFAMNYAAHMIKNRRIVPPNIEEVSAEGEAARAEFGQELYELNVQQYCCGGLNFGYYYDDSPLIVYDGEQQPAYTMADFTPSTVPGCRVPHFWLGDGRSLYDAMGPDYTLLRFDPAVNVEPLLSAAQQIGMLLKLLDVETLHCNVSTAYTTKLVLARPDQHVAWRGDGLPDDVKEMVGRVNGRLS
ncbi:MAG: FAD-dependent oxidoreductase [Ardenticatenaceae bacterium]|nr:FAD-dependent oxidoreductase [Ardenticatenaceae bacterium]